MGWWELMDIMETAIDEDLMVETNTVPETIDEGLSGPAFVVAQKILRNSTGKKTWLKAMVAAHIAAYGGFDVEALRPEPLASILASGQVVVYKGMIYSLDVWEHTAL